MWRYHYTICPSQARSQLLHTQHTPVQKMSNLLNHCQTNNIQHGRDFYSVLCVYISGRLLSSIWLENLEIPNNFQILSKNKKLGIILNHPNNVKITAQYLIDMFDMRSKIVNKIKCVPKMYHVFHTDLCPACFVPAPLQQP